MNLKILTIAAVMLAGGAAQAQPPGGPPSPERQAARAAVLQACAPELKTLCAGKEGAETMMCMRSNIEKASADCKAAMSKMPAPPR